MKLKKVFSTEGFYIHRNSNNVAWLPTPVEKGRAVSWLLEKLRAERGVFPVVGLGDSLSDHRFMKLCSWFGIPRQSQFAEAISQRIFGEEVTQPHETFAGSYQPGDVNVPLKPVVIEMTPVEQKRRADSVRKETLFGHAQPGSQHPHNGILICFTGRWIGGQTGLQKKSRSSLLLWSNASVMSPSFWPVLSGQVCPSALCCTRPCVIWGKTSWHYGISIIRDRGIDSTALDVIRSDTVPAVLCLLTDGQVKVQLPESLYAH